MGERAPEIFTDGERTSRTQKKILKRRERAGGVGKEGWEKEKGRKVRKGYKNCKLKKT